MKRKIVFAISASVLTLITLLIAASCLKEPQPRNNPVDPGATDLDGGDAEPSIGVYPDVQTPEMSVNHTGGGEFTISWTAADDSSTAQSDLQYALYKSTVDGALNSVADIEMNGSLIMNWSINTTSYDVTGYPAGTYYFAVLVKNGDGNKSAYNELEVVVSSDSNPPNISTSAINVDSTTTSSVDISWTKATDDESANVDLMYKVYTSGTANIGTVSDAEANGTEDSSWMTDTASHTIDGLNEGQTVHFNVIVKDAAGNKSAYNQGNATANTSGGDGETGVYAMGLAVEYLLSGDTRATSGWGDDASGNGTINYTDDSEGIQDSAIYFSGDDYLQVVNRPPLNATESYTISAWVKPDLAAAANGDYHVIDKYKDISGAGYRIFIEKSYSTYTLKAYMRIGGVAKSLSVQIEDYEWLHTALVYNGSTLSLYTNGSEADSIGVSGSPDTYNNDLYIGKNSVYDSSYFQGCIDDIRIFTNDLSVSELATIAGTGGGTSSTAPTFDSGYPYVANTDSNPFNLVSKMDQRGTLYYVLVNSGSGPYPPNKVKDPDSHGVTYLEKGSFNVTSVNPETFDIYYNLGSEEYWLYLVAENENYVVQSYVTNIVIDNSGSSSEGFSSGYPKVTATNATSIDITSKSDNQSGRHYFVVQMDGLGTPTVAQVKSGMNASGTVAIASGDVYAAAAADADWTASNLASETTYDVYVAFDPDSGDDAIESVLNVTTLTVPDFADGYPSVYSTTDNSITINVRSDDSAGTFYMVVVTAGSPNPMLSEIVAGTAATGMPAEANGSVYVNSSGTSDFLAATSLSAGTEYDIHTAFVDATFDYTNRGDTITTNTEFGPRFSPGYPYVSMSNHTGFEITYKVEKENGYLYYVVLEDGLNAPSADQVLNGLDGSGVPALMSGSQYVSYGSESSLNTENDLTHSTDYDIYAVFRGSGFTNGPVLLEAQTATAPDSTAPMTMFGYPRYSKTSATQIYLQYGYDEACDVYYVFLTNGAGAPTANQIMEGVDTNYNSAPFATWEVGLSANTSSFRNVFDTEINMTNNYDIYFTAVDQYGNKSTPTLLHMDLGYKTNFSFRAQGNGLMIVKERMSKPIVRIPSSVEGSNVVMISNAFNNDWYAEHVEIPDTVTNIVDSFHMAQALTSLTIPDSVKTISGSFRFSKNLHTVDFGNGVKEILDGSFQVLSNLTSITLPDSLRNIGRWSFAGQAAVPTGNLTNIKFGNGLTNIGESAFRYQFEIDALDMPASIVGIELYAFNTCSKLSTVKFYAAPPVNYGGATVFGIPDVDFTILVPSISETYYETEWHWYESYEIVGY